MPDKSYQTIINFAIKALSLRDETTAGHSYRVASLCVSIGEVLGLKKADLGILHTAGLLHDIGKLAMPDDILLKPDPLNGIEWQVMRQHPQIGADLLRTIPSFEPIVPIVEMHHEHWDGSGYPDGLSGEQIPLLARICAVAEAFDGLLSEQVYKPVWSWPDVLETMQLRAGKAFAPEVVAALQQVSSET